MYAMFFYVLQRSTLPSIFDCRGIYMWFFFFFRDSRIEKSCVCFFFSFIFSCLRLFSFSRKAAFFFFALLVVRVVEAGEQQQNREIATHSTSVCVYVCVILLSLRFLTLFIFMKAAASVCWDNTTGAAKRKPPPKKGSFLFLICIGTCAGFTSAALGLCLPFVFTDFLVSLSGYFIVSEARYTLGGFF